jgi:hypothetical protein
MQSPVSFTFGIFNNPFWWFLIIAWPAQCRGRGLDQPILLTENCHCTLEGSQAHKCILLETIHTHILVCIHIRSMGPGQGDFHTGKGKGAAVLTQPAASIDLQGSWRCSWEAKSKEEKVLASAQGSGLKINENKWVHSGVKDAGFLCSKVVGMTLYTIQG